MAVSTSSDRDIREMAEARVGFRRHALAYALVNLLLAAIWFVNRGGGPFELRSYWPIWTHLGWGVGLAFHAYSAYADPSDAIANEERKLRAKQGR